MTSRFVRSPDRITEQQLRRISTWDASRIIDWAFSTYGDRAAIGTSLQRTGMVQIDLAARNHEEFRVFTVDTLRFHEETYAFHETVEEVYGIELEVFKPDPTELENMLERHGEYLFFDGRELQQHCCDVRKGRPNDRALRTLDVWICGLRRDQSERRSEVPKAQIVEKEGRSLLKLAPLADWDEERVLDYTANHDVPQNPLYEQDFETISCRICTTPVQDGEPERAGRWRWFNDHDRECGLHFQDGGGI